MPKQNRRDRIDRKAAKVHSAYQEKAVINNDWKLDWFTPSKAQEEIVYGMDRHDLTIGHVRRCLVSVVYSPLHIRAFVNTCYINVVI